MQQLFNPDSKLMAWLGRFANLFILNILTLLCSLPVITIGASFTAMHTVLLAMQRQEDTHIVQLFFKALARNFLQSTLIWLFSLLHLLLLIVCFYAIGEKIIAPHYILVCLLFASAILQVILLTWVFILQGRYTNTIWATMKNAFITGIAHPGRTVAMVALFVSPFLLLFALIQAEALVICIGFSLPGFFQAKLYGPVIEKIDRMIPCFEETEPDEQKRSTVE